MQQSVVVHPYGSDPAQYAELYQPEGSPRGIVVVIHGGFWRAAYDASLGRPLSVSLAESGWIALNVEYRRVGNGGGWPNTFADVSDAINLLAELNLDTASVTAVGHSAGGHLATWAAGRSTLPASAPGASVGVPVTAVVSQAGVLDLRTAADRNVGGTACSDLLGGSPDEVPERYVLADPMARVPLSVPVVCVHSRSDDSVPYLQSEAYAAAAKRAGGNVELIEVEGDHMAHVDPASQAWTAVLTSLPRLNRS